MISHCISLITSRLLISKGGLSFFSLPKPTLRLLLVSFLILSPRFLFISKGTYTLFLFFFLRLVTILPFLGLSCFLPSLFILSSSHYLYVEGYCSYFFFVASFICHSFLFHCFIVNALLSMHLFLFFFSLWFYWERCSCFLIIFSDNTFCFNLFFLIFCRFTYCDIFCSFESGI